MAEFLLAKCANPNSDMLGEICANEGLNWEDVYASAEEIAAFARKVRAARGQAYAMVPFCHTLEAEALGAHIVLGDEHSVARVKEPLCSSLKEVLELRWNEAQAPRIGRMLEAVQLLEETGEPVMFALSGPLSILSCLVDLRVVFREQRKHPELFQAVMAWLLEQLLPFAQRVAQSGAEGIEYADPPAAISIVGPAFASLLYEEFGAPYIEALLKTMPNESKLFVCPLAATKELKEQLAGKCSCKCPKH